MAASMPIQRSRRKERDCHMLSEGHPKGAELHKRSAEASGYVLARRDFWPKSRVRLCLPGTNCCRQRHQC